MPFEIIRNDITNMKTDAIVNTANPKPLIGFGVDAGIYRRAGKELLKARRKIGRIAVGSAAITPGFELEAKFVVHTVGPVWNGGCNGETEQLRQCYENSLKLALENECTSIAFPLISAGNHGFPKPIALKIAVDAFSSFLMEHEMNIVLVVFSKDAFELSEKLFNSVKSFIDERYIKHKTLEEYGVSDKCNVREAELRQITRALDAKRSILPTSSMLSYEACSVPDSSKDYNAKHSRPLSPTRAMPENSGTSDEFEAQNISIQPMYNKSCNADNDFLCIDDAGADLEAMLKKTDAGFSETLLKLIDKTGKKDSEIYKRANVDRKLFSKIRNNPGYKPSKSTALAFAIALELNLDEAKDFISRAGYALSHSSKFDIIIEYFILNKKYDMFEINETLFAFDQTLLGA